MVKYIANMDLHIGGKLFQKKDEITAKLRGVDVSFLLENNMILEKTESNRPPKQEGKSENKDAKNKDAEDKEKQSVK